GVPGGFARRPTRLNTAMAAELTDAAAKGRPFASAGDCTAEIADWHGSAGSPSCDPRSMTAASFDRQVALPPFILQNKLLEGDVGCVGVKVGHSHVFGRPAAVYPIGNHDLSSLVD